MTMEECAILRGGVACKAERWAAPWCHQREVSAKRKVDSPCPVRTGYTVVNLGARLPGGREFLVLTVPAPLRSDPSGSAAAAAGWCRCLSLTLLQARGR